MDEYTRKIRLKSTRTKTGAIVDVSGTTGDWPFRRTISYHVGVNCDSISVGDGELRVKRRGRTIAVAEPLARPSSLARLLRAALDALLHPRHARRAGDAQSQNVSWEDLLRPPRK